MCNEDQYHYGYNGQMKVNEYAGVGNHTTALYWDYDTRTGRRDNLEPKLDKIPYLSPYSTNADNPILYKDKNGDIFGIDDALIAAFLIAGFTNASIDWAAQVAANKLTHKKNIYDVDWFDIGTSFIVGGLTMGESTIGTTTKAGIKIAGVVAKASIDFKPSSTGFQYVGGTNEHNKPLIDFGIDAAAGGLGLYTGAVSNVAGDLAQDAQAGLGKIVKYGTNTILNTINKTQAKGAHEAEKKAAEWRKDNEKLLKKQRKQQEKNSNYSYESDMKFGK